MPTTSVKGHAGKMVMGQVDGRNLICLAGRVHGYEGKTSQSNLSRILINH